MYRYLLFFLVIFCSCSVKKEYILYTDMFNYNDITYFRNDKLISLGSMVSVKPSEENWLEIRYESYNKIYFYTNITYQNNSLLTYTVPHKNISYTIKINNHRITEIKEYNLISGQQIPFTLEMFDNDDIPRTIIKRIRKSLSKLCSSTQLDNNIYGMRYLHGELFIDLNAAYIADEWSYYEIKEFGVGYDILVENGVIVDLIEHQLSIENDKFSIDMFDTSLIFEDRNNIKTTLSEIYFLQHRINNKEKYIKRLTYLNQFGNQFSNEIIVDINQQYHNNSTFEIVIPEFYKRYMITVQNHKVSYIQELRY